MEKNALNVTCQDTGILHQCSVKLAIKKDITILWVKNVSIAQMKNLFGTELFVLYVQFKLQSGMENIVIIALQELIGMQIFQNALLVPMVKFIVQLRINVFAQFRHHLCWLTALVLFVTYLTIGMKETESV